MGTEAEKKKNRNAAPSENVLPLLWGDKRRWRQPVLECNGGGNLFYAGEILLQLLLGW
jgi:hypothetical protein